MDTIMSLFAAVEGGIFTWLLRCVLYYARYDGVPRPHSPNPLPSLPLCFQPPSCSPGSPQLLLPDPRLLLVSAGGLHTSQTPASMFQFLNLAADFTHFLIMMHKDVTQNNPELRKSFAFTEIAMEGDRVSKRQETGRGKESDK